MSHHTNQSESLYNESLDNFAMDTDNILQGDLSNVQCNVYRSVHWTSHFLLGTRKHGHFNLVGLKENNSTTILSYIAFTRKVVSIV